MHTGLEYFQEPQRCVPGILYEVACEQSVNIWTLIALIEHTERSRDITYQEL